ncbi:MAG TPA: 6-carboxytetrahydropterin synthase [Beijerinckiaceae bacterium]|nr:6-carboxytetrahydropterin synthase [Beijerinckiaceae bacterium]
MSRDGEAAGRVALYRTVKQFGHSEGLSCCFRQWRATHSHCTFLHGYALAFTFHFVTDRLDANNWCYDFGGMKEVRAWLHSMFDHTVLVAEDDPDLETFQDLARRKIVDLRVLPRVGCEAVAELAAAHVAAFIDKKTRGRVWLERVDVAEHDGNSASYAPPSG